MRHAFRPALDDIAAILKDHPEIGRCAIEGHTDATGPETWNKKLSLERAKSVAVYLISKGVDPARVVAIGQGEALPWATNQTEAGRAANRRVIFHIEGVSDDQEKKELEIQRQRARKETGAPLEPDTAAAAKPVMMGPPVPPGLSTDDAKSAAKPVDSKTKAGPSPPVEPKATAKLVGPPVPPGLVTDDAKPKDAKAAASKPTPASPQTKAPATTKPAASAKGPATPDAGTK
ncbi:MAG TPA: OmpA family protein [Polyangia bacterium]|nr:OmpA family protein [Polyangia bacterium]